MLASIALILSIILVKGIYQETEQQILFFLKQEESGTRGALAEEDSYQIPLLQKAKVPESLVTSVNAVKVGITFLFIWLLVTLSVWKGCRKMLKQSTRDILGMINN